MTGFSDPIIGGGGALVYPSIHSPNYVTEVSGWTINKDGSAEFDNLTIRGTFFGLDWILNSQGIFFYSGTPAAGNLIFAISQGTDPFGNTPQAGISAQNGAAAAWLSAGALRLTNGSENSPASIIDGGGYLSIESVVDMTGHVAAVLNLTPGSPALAAFTCPLGIPGEASAPPSVAGSVVHYADNGIVQAKYVSPDGNAYNTGRISLIGGHLNFTSTSPVTIPGMSAPVAAGTYRISGFVNGLQGGAAAATLINFSGPATSLVSIRTRAYLAVSGSTSESLYPDILAALGSVTSTAFTAGDAFGFDFDGVITFSAAGTFAIQGAQGSSGHNWSVTAGSYCDLMPVT